MSVLQALTDAIRDSSVEVIDLTAPLSAETPIIQLPEPFGNTARFGLTEISHYDERGPAWYWNDIVTGEHTGTHFDAPVHWVTGQDGEDVAQVPVTRLIAPAVVLDFSAEAAADPDFLLEIEHVKQWEAEHGPLPEGGWLLYRTGWDVRSADQAGVPQRERDRPAHAGDQRRLREVAGRGVAADRARHRDRRHRRRGRALLRPAVPLPLDRCSGRASTASRSCRTWPGCRSPARS